ncbi:MAG: efflux RND transporter permease subunit [Puniceicoccales bacterium]|jgi:HAE1 family hydrophobic/amphiphilic exporter-1|nr:efflux RND transporter permease subunit [Puniceicoccales bacterium]
MKSISEPFIRRPVMTVLVATALTLMGLYAYRSLPVSDLPSVDYPVIQVFVSFPGMDAAMMAANVATPLEKEFLKISSLELVTSKNMQGQSNLTLQFKLDRNIDAAAMDVQSAISRATGKLPRDLPSPPVFQKSDPNSHAIYFMCLRSETLTNGELYDYARDEVAQRISVLPGVSQADIYGISRAVRISLNLQKLASRGLTMDNVVQAIQSGTVTLAAGSLKGDGGTLVLKPEGQLKTPEEYESVVVAYKNGSPVYLKDLGEAVEGLEVDELKNHFWLRGSHFTSGATVAIATSKAAGANAVEVSREVNRLIPVLRAQLPGSIELVPIYDRSKTIIASIDDVKETILIAFALVVVVIFLFLGRLTETVIPVVALPLSLLITFVVMRFLGYSLDNLSLLALTLSVGFLVDDAIVFLENMVRRMEDFRESPFEASIESGKEISFTILAMTLSLCAVFIPMVLLPGQMGRVFREFSVTIIVAIFASGVISLTVTPLMCARMLRPIQHDARTKLEIFSHHLEHGFLKFYGWTLDKFLNWKVLAILIWLLSLVGTFYAFRVLPTTFLPEGDSGMMTGVFIAQEGTSPRQMGDYQSQVEAVLKSHPSVRQFITLTGLSGMITPNQGLMVGFLEGGKRPKIQEVVRELSGKFFSIPGIFAAMRPMPNLSINTGAISTSQGKYTFILRATDTASLYAAAGKLLADLRKNPGFSSLSSDMFLNNPTAEMRMDRRQAAGYGITAQDFENALKQNFSENFCAQIKEERQQYQVIAVAQKDQRSGVADLNRLYLRSRGDLLPLPSVVDTEEKAGPLVINHTNNFPSVSIFFDLQPSYTIGEATAFIEARAKALTSAGGVSGEFEGEAKTFRETHRAILGLLGLAILVLYFILGVLYESYVHPLTVLSVLPVAAVGGLWTLFFCRQELSLYGFIGLFMLLGVVLKNGIMMIDFALERQKEGASAREAAHKACMDRFRPIIMTTLSTLMGMLPIAVGWGADGASRLPLGLVIVGGLVVSQIVTLYILPAFFIYFDTFQTKILDRIPFFAREVR